MKHEVAPRRQSCSARSLCAGVREASSTRNFDHATKRMRSYHAAMAAMLGWWALGVSKGFLTLITVAVFLHFVDLCCKVWFLMTRFGRENPRHCLQQ